MEMAISSLSNDRDESGTADIIVSILRTASISDLQQLQTTSKQQNMCCLNIKRNLQIAAIQLSAQSRDRVKYDELEKRNQQMVEQMAEHNTYVESLTNQLYALKNQLRMAEMESETAKRREVDIQKQLDLIEASSAALRKKAEASETYKNRYERAIAVCEDLQKKRLEISEHMKKLTEVAKKSKTEAENTKQACDSMKADKVAAMAKIRLYKKHVPVMLKLIDELASKAGNLPFYTRKKIDSLASHDIRQQLLGGQAQEGSEHHVELSESDDDVNDLENLISVEVAAVTPVKNAKEQVKHVDMLSAPEEPAEVPRVRKSPTRTSPRRSERTAGAFGGRGRRVEFQTRKQHNLEETEKAFNDKLLSKLHNNEPTAVQSEIPGGHRSIHGKKGPTIREQQAKMMSVAEKVALMRVAEEPQPSSSSAISFGVSPSTVKSPRRRQRTNSFDLNSDLRMTPSPEKLTLTSSQESPVHEEREGGAEKRDLQRLETTPSMPHLDEIEPLFPIPSPMPISPKLTVHPSMPQLEEMVQERVDEDESPIVVPTKTRTAHKASPKKKVTFQLEEDVTAEPDFEASERKASKPAEIKPLPSPDVEQKVTDTKVMESVVEHAELLSDARNEYLRKETGSTNKAQTTASTDLPTILPVKSAPSTKSSVAGSKIPTEGANKKETLESTLSSPTKRALKTISSVTTELKSPVKTIPQWSQVANKFIHKKDEPATSSEESQQIIVDEEIPLEIYFDEQDDAKEEKEETTESIEEQPAEEEPRETADVAVQKKTPDPKRRIVNAPKAFKPRASSPQLTFMDDILSGAAGRTRSIPFRPSAPKKKEDGSVPVVTAVQKTKTVAKSKFEVPDSSKEKKDDEETFTSSAEKPSPMRPTRTNNAAGSQKSLTSKMEQASKALSKRLKSASTMPKAPIPKQVAPKIPNPAVTKAVVVPTTKEKDNEKNPIEHDASGPSKAPVKSTTSKSKEPVRKVEMLNAVPVKRQARQLKRKAAEDALPPKKLCLVATPTETLLKKVLDLDCSLDVLSKKIPAEEIEQLKTIDVETFADIIVEHVVRMKTVDMWHSVVNSWKKRSVELPVNKSEENVLQIAHQLSSEEGDIFASLTNRLMFKIYCHPNMDTALCHRIIRLLGMCCQASEQIDENSNDSKERLKSLVQFLARKRSTLLGKSIVYLVNRLSFHFIEFLAKEQWTDVRRILVLYSEEDVLRIIDTYWQAKSTSSLNLPKKEEVFSWILNELVVASIPVHGLKFDQDQLDIDEKLREFFQLRSVCLLTPKTFPSTIQESKNLINQIRSALDAYKAEQKSDNIVSSLFGGRPSASDVNDPDTDVSKKIALGATALSSLMDSVILSQSFIGRDKTRLFLENLTEILDSSHELLVFLSEHTDNQSESRRILVNSLSNLLTACQPLTKYKLSV